MDIDLARTFLAVFETGNFNRAADQINVTQSTVSTRILNLEEQLGRSLFSRSRAGTTPTMAGRQFHSHAANMVRIWQQARMELVLPASLNEVFSIGGQYTLWDELLAAWLPWMRRHLPKTAVRVEIGSPDVLIRMLLEGALDIGVMYMPQTRAGLVIEKLLEDKLVLVSTLEGRGGPGEQDYVYIDWGPEFHAEHAMAFSDLPYPAISLSHGMLGLTHILNNGGSGYFPQRLVGGYLKSKQLHRVSRTPWFSRPSYIVFPIDRGEDANFQKALKGLRAIASKRS